MSQDPEHEQKDDSRPEVQPGSSQGTEETIKGPPEMDPYEPRIQKLQNRQDFLLKMQHFRNLGEDQHSTAEMANNKSKQDCELEAIQKELVELLHKKSTFGKQEESSEPDEQNEYPVAQTDEKPSGEVCMLQPIQVQVDDITPEQEAEPTPAEENPKDAVVPVASLGQKAAVTLCPSCQEIVLTDTSNRAGKATWVFCCLCSMLGCVAGCCLIPFFMDNVKDVHHQCPRCQAHIHTYRPFDIDASTFA